MIKLRVKLSETAATYVLKGNSVDIAEALFEICTEGYWPTLQVPGTQEDEVVILAFKPLQVVK